jgi:hypothetical protein
MTFFRSLLVLALLLPGQASGADFVHDFRRGNMPPRDRMVLNGMDSMVEATPEDGGLRIKILANRGKAGAGMQTKFSLTGDFEITASYEILSADKPTKGYGVGVYLTISPAAWKDKRAALARCWTVQGGSGFQPVIIISGPEPINKSGWEKSETMTGQLRLRREEAKLFYLVNEGMEQPFREIFQCDYGKDDIDLVRLVANPGSSPAAIDIRLLDVRMRWGGLPNHDKTAPSLAPPLAPSRAPPVGTAAGGEAPDAQMNPPSKGRLATSLFVVIVIALSLASALGLVVYVRRRRGTKTPKGDVAAEKAALAMAPRCVAIACAACGKKLKVKAELTGKRVKCPQCRTVMLVPNVGGA